MSRGVYLLGVGLALVALAFVGTDWVVRPSCEPGPTEANVRRIRPGMTLDEVEAILGEWSFPPSRARSRYFWWQNPAGAVTVIMGRNSRVERIVWDPSPQASPSLLARIRIWLGW
jgi:hypothetical protein